MSLKTLARSAGSKVTNTFGKQILAVKSNSPVILFGTGVVGFGATVFLACRATMKVGDVLAEGEKKINEVDSSAFLEEGAKKKTIFGVKLETAIEIAKLYAPAAIAGTVALSSFCGAHGILKKRNAGLAAAYATVDRAFKDYRKRVVEDQGEEKDFEYLHGVEEREIVEEGKNGPEVKTIKGLDADKLSKKGSMYARVFDDRNENWNPVPTNRLFHITSVEKMFNDLLIDRGYVFLNEIYDAMGFEQTPEGQLVGWVRNSEGDNKIIMTIWENGVHEGKEWIRGNRDSILVDFNVDGPILDRFKGGK